MGSFGKDQLAGFKYLLGDQSGLVARLNPNFEDESDETCEREEQVREALNNTNHRKKCSSGEGVLVGGAEKE